MNETKLTYPCERAEELVAYFYNEATPAERANFTQHLAQCPVCREELAAFGEVREAVGEWRAQILSTAPALSFTESAAPRIEPAHVLETSAHGVAVPHRPAFAALREFFRFSPLWVRAGTVAVTLLVCTLATLAVLNAEIHLGNGGISFRTNLHSAQQQQGLSSTQIAANNERSLTQAELDKIVTERDAALRELEDTRAQLDNSREANLMAAVSYDETAPASTSVAPTRNNSRSVRNSRTSNSAPSQIRAPKLARNNFKDDEENLPRLSDLLGEVNR